MPGELPGVEPQPSSVLLHDVGHALIGQPIANRAVAVDAAEDRARLNAGGGNPLFEGDDRAGDLAEWDSDGLAGALLIGLAVADRDFHPVRRVLDVLEVEGDQLRSAEGAG